MATAFLAVCGMAGEPADPVVDAAVAAHNREWKHEKLGPLKLSPLLSESACAHARDMASHHKLDHKGTDGSTVTDRVKGVGYHRVRVGENIAEGQKTVDEVMTTWMKSPATAPTSSPITPRWEPPWSKTTRGQVLVRQLWNPDTKAQARRGRRRGG